jgi:hypothetical protein
MDAIDVLVEGTKNGVALVCERKGIVVKDYEALSTALRDVLQEKRPGYMQEWKEALAANVGAGMLQMVVNAQCQLAAIEALQKCGLLGG